MSLEAERMAFLDGGRLAADGVPFGDLARVRAAVGRGARWYDAWMQASQHYEALAADKTASSASRGGWLWLGAMSAHAAGLYWLEDAAEKRSAEDRRSRLYEQAAGHLRPRATSVHLQVGFASVPAFLRRPARPRGGRGATVAAAILLGGLDSTKEESRLFEDLLLARGVATLTFDGPGQGTTARTVPLGPRFDAWVSAAVTLLASIQGIDAARIGLVGRSLGGSYALQAAAHEPRIRACAAWSPLVRGTSYDAMPEGVRRTFQYACGGLPVAATRSVLTELLTVTEDASRLECPTLVTHGKLDRIVSPGDMAALEHAAARSVETVVYEDGSHCCHNIASVVRPQLADWLSARLDAARRPEAQLAGAR
jgi:2,6-dihydroxypseudooxynicotine hydrolase